MITKPLDEILRTTRYSTLSDVELTVWLGGTPASRYNRVTRALSSGDLIRLRRGLYCIGESWRRGLQLNLYELAQRIYGPSYISLESALSYHGWIPEAVYTTTSVCVKRNKTFNTPLGDFSFQKIPAYNFFIDVERVVEGKNIYLMAQPWKALGDLVYCNKYDWVGIEPLVESLRIEEELLKESSVEEFDTLIKFYNSKRMTRFFQGVKKELGL